MANFTYYPNVIANDSTTYAYIPGTGTLTSFVLRDVNGNAFTFTGQDFAYSSTRPTGGLITGLVQSNELGQSVLGATNMNVTVADLVAAFVKAPIDGGLAVLTLLTDGRDVVRGGTADDVLFGGAKADRMFGGGGMDFLVSGHGNDTLSGGGQSDTFMFERTGDGANVITDFTDKNGAQDDFIQITRATYRAMVVTEDATGVLLTFSATSSVHVDGWHAADVGITDFFFA